MHQSTQCDKLHLTQLYAKTEELDPLHKYESTELLSIHSSSKQPILSTYF